MPSPGLHERHYRDIAIQQVRLVTHMHDYHRSMDACCSFEKMSPTSYDDTTLDHLGRTLTNTSSPSLIDIIPSTGFPSSAAGILLVTSSTSNRRKSIATNNNTNRFATYRPGHCVVPPPKGRQLSLRVRFRPFCMNRSCRNSSTG